MRQRVGAGSPAPVRDENHNAGSDNRPQGLALPAEVLLRVDRDSKASRRAIFPRRGADSQDSLDDQRECDERDERDDGAKQHCRIKAHARARAIPRQLSQSRVAMTPGTASRLLVVVHCDSGHVPNSEAERVPASAPGGDVWSSPGFVDT
jgi:hypothetical protein